MMLSSPTRIAVVDDHHLFREGVMELLQSVPEFDIVADGASGESAVAIVNKYKPDVLILDVEMPGPGATTTIRRVLDASPNTRVVILTMHDDANLVRDLLGAGAAAYLLKSARLSELVAAISTASRNDGAVLLAVSRGTVMSLGRTGQQEDDILSGREREVLTLLAQGKSNLQIASALFISNGTVKRHLTNIYNKLGSTSRLSAVQNATRLGLLADIPADDRGQALHRPRPNGG